MKKLMPVLLALLGLGAGIGAGLALKPTPEKAADACAPAAEGHENAPSTAEHGEAPATTETAPCDADEAFAAASAKDGPAIEGEVAYVPMEKPFVVPIFKDDKVAAMVVVSLAVETGAHEAPAVEGLKPRLRDSFLKVMFRHANSGGFDGSFTGGRKMEDLKSALRAAAREVMPHQPVGEVLITEIARQDS